MPSHVTSAGPVVVITPTAALGGSVVRLYPRGMGAYQRGSADGRGLWGTAADQLDNGAFAKNGLHLYYIDADAGASFESVTTAGGTIPFPCPISCSLSARASGMVDVCYADGGAVYVRTARTAGWTGSQDMPFGAAQAVASGSDWMLASHWFDERGGLLWAMLYRDSTASWYIAAGSLGDDGVTWTFTTPHLVLAADKNGGSLIGSRVDSGAIILRFACVVGGAVTLYTCRAPAGDGTGAWDGGQTIAAAGGGYTLPALCLDERDGMLGCALYKATAGPPAQFVAVGTLGDDGVTWSFGTPRQASTNTDGQQAALWRRADGVWELFSPFSGTFALVSARALAADGSGLWL